MDLLLLLVVSVMGLVDVQCERYTGQGLIGHVADYVKQLNA